MGDRKCTHQTHRSAHSSNGKISTIAIDDDVNRVQYSIHNVNYWRKNSCIAPLRSIVRSFRCSENEWTHWELLRVFRWLCWLCANTCYVWTNQIAIGSSFINYMSVLTENRMNFWKNDEKFWVRNSVTYFSIYFSIFFITFWFCMCKFRSERYEMAQSRWHVCRDKVLIIFHRVFRNFGTFNFFVSINYFCSSTVSFLDNRTTSFGTLCSTIKTPINC